MKTATYREKVFASHKYYELLRSRYLNNSQKMSLGKQNDRKFAEIFRTVAATVLFKNRYYSATLYFFRL